MGLFTDAGKAIGIVLAAASMLGLNDKQIDDLRKYAIANSQGWVATMKRDEEVEVLIKEEAARIARD